MSGEHMMEENLPDPVSKDNYKSAIEFEDYIEATFVEEKAMGMVLGPYTIQEPAQACNCRADQLCPGPLGAVQEAEKKYEQSMMARLVARMRRSNKTRRKRPPYRQLQTAYRPYTGALHELKQLPWALI